jgi:acyl carrier protein
VAWIAPAEGIAMLERLMQGAPAHVAACLIDWGRLFEAQAAGSAFLGALRPRRQGGHSGHGEPGRAGAGSEGRAHVAAAAEDSAAQLEALRQATPARRADLLLARVADEVAHVLGAGDGRTIDPEQPLNELGMDSLMSVELRNRLTSAFALARSLPATLVFDHPTVAALARHLLGLLFADDTPAPAPAAAAPATDAVQAIDELSDEQIEALFARRTAKT